MIEASGEPIGALNVGAAYALLQYMSAISRRLYRTEWRSGLESILFEDIATDTGEAPSILNDVERVTLAELYNNADGWWSWKNHQNKGPTFIEKEIWEAAFAGEE